MLSIHPIIQFSATLLAFYVFYLGVQRFRSLHLKHKVRFNWKRHVALGMVVLITWPVGLLTGIILVRTYWHGFLITETHGKVALAMAPLILFGLFSGLYMDRVKKRRTLLPLIHGINNLVVLALALAQVVIGWGVYNTFVLGN
ncbi:MAG: DUF4079 domain-containing protein [Proteobacteria bacterium]|nr:DUF4079 domain-containing protein [Pseudomonadota bacterium]MBU4258164.1 DUF4079 domain-containing protein [Pseudomonadota bacterium]MBU4287436.1 DUF4079 domain-containing protein [Pseudomonadota bacterium]MBU4413910.1 DUF4079 domain-containing protein [Pseudomonadota bacterium]